MHTKILIADIKIVLIYLIILSIIIIFFPILLIGKLKFSLEDKKIHFKIYMLKFIRVIRGYVEFLEDGIFIHLTKKTAIMIPYKKMLGIRATVKPLKDYHLIYLNLRLELGNETNILPPLSLAFLEQFAFSFVNWFIHNRKPYLKLINHVNVYEEQRKFKIALEIKMYFNIFMIILSLFKMIIEGVINGISKRKQQN